MDTNLTTFSGTEHRSTTVCTISLTRDGSNLFFAGLLGKAGDGFPVSECVASILKKVKSCILSCNKHNQNF